MNVRKPIDYSAMFAVLNTLMAVDGQKAPLSPRRSTYAVCTLTPPASLPGTCAGCGSFSGHTKAPQRCWPRP